MGKSDRAEGGQIMNIITKQISDLIPYENNPKIHTDRQIEQIAKSIELTKGLRQPIVIDKNNVIVCGHGRYMAAKKLGYKEVPCELVDDLTDDEIKAYRLIDNRIAQGEFDIDLEVSELENIELDLSDFDFNDGFSLTEIDEVEGYDKRNDSRDFFEKVFTFPTSKKKQIVNYLKKHYDEVISRIIDDAENNY